MNQTEETMGQRAVAVWDEAQKLSGARGSNVSEEDFAQIQAARARFSAFLRDGDLERNLATVTSFMAITIAANPLLGLLFLNNVEVVQGLVEIAVESEEGTGVKETVGH